jgi:hypothetical protein
MEKISTVAVFVLLAIVGWAQADSPSASGSPGSNDREVGHSVSLQGVIHFEERHTVVPLSFCESPGHCYESKTYWSILVESNTEKFEVDQQFDEGQDTQPQSVTIDGKSVQPGSVVKLEATIEYASQNYFIVGNVRDVNETTALAEPSLPNWTCRGTYDRQIQIQADVWYVPAQNTTQTNRYGMRVVGIEEAPVGRTYYPLASLLNGQAEISREAMVTVYEGQTADANLQLSVDQSTATNQVPAKLKFSLARVPEQVGAKIPSSLDLDVSCSRSR